MFHVCGCVTELAPVEELRGRVHGDQMWLQWKPPNTEAVTEYVVQWVTGDQMDWQRENRSTRHTVIKGKCEAGETLNICTLTFIL